MEVIEVTHDRFMDELKTQIDKDFDHNIQKDATFLFLENSPSMILKHIQFNGLGSKYNGQVCILRSRAAMSEWQLVAGNMRNGKYHGQNILRVRYTQDDKRLKILIENYKEHIIDPIGFCRCDVYLFVEGQKRLVSCFNYFPSYG